MTKPRRTFHCWFSEMLSQNPPCIHFTLEGKPVEVNLVSLDRMASDFNLIHDKVYVGESYQGYYITQEDWLAIPLSERESVHAYRYREWLAGSKTSESSGNEKEDGVQFFY